MRKFILLSLTVFVLAGCANGKYAEERRLRKEATSEISQVEIFYNQKDEYVVIDGGGSGYGGMAGGLGFAGMLVALAADAGHKLSAVDRAETRSKEFTSALEKSEIKLDMNRQFAESLAEKIKTSGRDVKLTPINRTVGGLKDMKLPEDVVPSEGYATLLLRINSGYAAKDASSDFMPVIVVETLLNDKNNKTIYRNTYNPGMRDPSYFLYSSLLAEHGLAHEGLRKGMMSSVDRVYASVFEISP